MIKRLCRQMTIPQIFSVMTASLCMLIDSIVIGRLLGVDAMSAFGLAAPILIIFAALGTMLSVGVQMVCSRALGLGDMDQANSCFSSSVVLALVISALCMFLVLVLRTPLCVLLGAGRPGSGNAIFTLTENYLAGYVLLLPCFFLSQITSPYLQTMGKRRLLVWSVAAMTAADIVFDLLSVYVWKAGIFGIGLASGISYLAVLLVCIGYFLGKSCPFRFSAKSLSVGTGWELLRSGSPVIIAQVLFVVRVYCYNRLLLVISGTEAVAAFSVLCTLGNILYSIGLGAGSVMMILASLFYSERDRGALVHLVRRMLPYAALLIAGAVVLCEIASPWIIQGFFIKDTSAYALALTGFRLFLPAQTANSLSTVYKNYCQGIRQMWFTNLIALLEGLVMAVFFAWSFSRIWGLNGVWAGTVCGQFATLAVIALIVWKKYGRVSFTADAFSFLDPAFGVDPADYREYAVTDRDSVIETSKQAADFCREKGLDSKSVLMFSLCIEEMCMNVVTHGFTDSSRRHHLDVRIIIEEDRRLIRFRDDCSLFDPTGHLAVYEDSDPSAHIGIRMTMALVRNATYVNSLGLNNLTLIL